MRGVSPPPDKSKFASTMYLWMSLGHIKALIFPFNDASYCLKILKHAVNHLDNFSLRSWRAVTHTPDYNYPCTVVVTVVVAPVGDKCCIFSVQLLCVLYEKAEQLTSI